MRAGLEFKGSIEGLEYLEGTTAEAPLPSDFIRARKLLLADAGNERIKYEQRIKWTDLWKKAEIAVCSRIRAGDSYVYSVAPEVNEEGDVACE